jgi:hypothetical protein
LLFYMKKSPPRFWRIPLNIPPLCVGG